MAAPAAEGFAVTALRSAMLRVLRAAEHPNRLPESVRVVVVLKTKPVSLIREVYDAGHPCFCENYVQEIDEKAPQMHDDVEWHFVGHLQSNKVKTLLSGVSNLAMFEWVNNEKIANHVDRAISSLGRNPLKVLVQVNTSGEESKYGSEPANCVELAKHVKLNCPNLMLSGLMTIGMPDCTSMPSNFKSLYNCRTEICKALGIAEELCELSMGMSGDFEPAIEMGSTNMRISSTIFGPRTYPRKQSDWRALAPPYKCLTSHRCMPLSMSVSLVPAAPLGAGAQVANKNRRMASAEQLVLGLHNNDLRENAFLDFLKRAFFQDLAPLLWNSFGSIAALLQEIVSMYPMLSPPTSNPAKSNWFLASHRHKDAVPQRACEALRERIQLPGDGFSR